jgi:hypothetical protein
MPLVQCSPQKLCDHGKLCLQPTTLDFAKVQHNFKSWIHQGRTKIH